jgi:hypothetical protein
VPSGEQVPLLRLAWLSDAAPAAGFDTEIVLVPRAGTDVDDLLAGIAAQVCDRLLELPALAQITVEDDAVTAVRGDGEIRFNPTDSPIPGAGNVWREAVTGDVRWLGRDTRDGGRVAATEERLYRDPETLRTPTPTDIDISVPARVIAPLPVTPDRRHLMPGVDVGTLAPGYVELVRAFSPAQRPGFVPRALPRNSVDARLLESIGEELAANAWRSWPTPTCPARSSVRRSWPSAHARSGWPTSPRKSRTSTVPRRGGRSSTRRWLPSSRPAPTPRNSGRCPSPGLTDVATWGRADW